MKAVTNYQDSKMLAELSEDLGEAMVGINEQEIQLLMAERANKMKIGILAVQGAFAEHRAKLEKLGAQCVELRKKEDLESGFDGLVLPGGESTVQGKLLRELDMFQPLKEKIEAGMPVLATCAGLILLADHLSNDEHVYFGTMPVTVKRNAYGNSLAASTQSRR